MMLKVVSNLSERDLYEYWQFISMLFAVVQKLNVTT